MMVMVMVVVMIVGSHCGLLPRPIPEHGVEGGVEGDGDIGGGGVDVAGGDVGVGDESSDDVGVDSIGVGGNLPQRAPSVQLVHCTLSKDSRRPEHFFATNSGEYEYGAMVQSLHLCTIALSHYGAKV